MRRPDEIPATDDIWPEWIDLVDALVFEALHFHLEKFAQGDEVWRIAVHRYHYGQKAPAAATDLIMHLRTRGYGHAR